MSIESDYNKYSKIFSGKKVSVEMQNNNTEDNNDIKTISAHAGTLNSMDEANKYFDSLAANNPQFVKLNTDQYKYNDYYINTAKKYFMMPQIKGLKAISSLKLSCAPEFVDFINLKNNNDCVLITKINGTKDKNVVPYKAVKSNVPMSAKTNFYKDIETIVQKGYTNNSVINQNTWFFVPTTQTIILGDWSRFRGFKNDEEKLKYKSQIANLLGMIY